MVPEEHILGPLPSRRGQGSDNLTMSWKMNCPKRNPGLIEIRGPKDPSFSSSLPFLSPSHSSSSFLPLIPFHPFLLLPSSHLHSFSILLSFLPRSSIFPFFLPLFLSSLPPSLLSLASCKYSGPGGGLLNIVVLGNEAPSLLLTLVVVYLLFPVL